MAVLRAEQNTFVESILLSRHLQWLLKEAVAVGDGKGETCP